MPMRQGKCVNFGNCEKADSKTIIQIAEGEDFVCPDDGKTLESWVPPDPHSRLKPILVGSVLILALGSAFFAFRSPGAAKPDSGSKPLAASSPAEAGGAPTAEYGKCKLKPPPDPDVLRAIEYVKQGMHYATLRMYEQSAQEFDKVITIDQHFLGMNQNIGAAMIALRKFPDAEAALQRELELNDCLRDLKDEELTRFAYMIETGASSAVIDKAVRIAEFRSHLARINGATHYNLAVIYAQERKYQDSLAELQRAIDKGLDARKIKEDPDLQEALARPEFQKLISSRSGS